MKIISHDGVFVVLTVISLVLSYFPCCYLLSFRICFPFLFLKLSGNFLNSGSMEER